MRKLLIGWAVLWLALLILASGLQQGGSAGAQATPQLLNLAVSRVSYDPATNSDAAFLVVKTAEASSIIVDYGTSADSCPAAYTDTRSSSGQSRHEVPLEGLNPSSGSSTTVCYRVKDAETNAVMAQNSFRTARRPGESLSFAVAADVMPWGPEINGPSAGWNTIAGQMASEGLDLALLDGDIVHNYWNETSATRVEAKYNGLFSATMQLTDSTPLYAAVGNHEQVYIPVCRTAYEREFTLPTSNGPASGYGEHYYSFDSGDTHFVALSTEIVGEEGLITGDQLLWLEQDLGASQKAWKVIYFHRPLFYPAEIEPLMAPYERWFDPDDPAGTENRAHLISLFEQAGVDVVFGGHAHWYHHRLEGGIHYVVTGGGGATISPGDDPGLGPGDLMLYRGYEHVKVDETAGEMRVAMIDIDEQRRELFILNTGGSFVDYIDSGDAPVFSSVSPSGTIDTESAVVTAYFVDNAESSGIDLSSASLTVDGAIVSDCIATESAITCTASGLQNGDHAVAASVSDNTGNRGEGDGNFSVELCEPARPHLTLGMQKSYWASFEDFQARQLSVDYYLTNLGAGEARGVEIAGAVNSNGVAVASPVPFPLGAVGSGTGNTFTLKYSIPVMVPSFKSTIYAEAGDACGVSYEYPGPMPGA